MAFRNPTPLVSLTLKVSGEEMQMGMGPYILKGILPDGHLLFCIIQGPLCSESSVRSLTDQIMFEL